LRRSSAKSSGLGQHRSNIVQLLGSVFEKVEDNAVEDSLPLCSRKDLIAILFLHLVGFTPNSGERHMFCIEVEA